MKLCVALIVEKTYRLRLAASTIAGIFMELRGIWDEEFSSVIPCRPIIAYAPVSARCARSSAQISH